jgi:8-oxo-dGTP diphosphatase
MANKLIENSSVINRPKVGLGVYILNEKDELLLLQRKGSHGQGDWCPPGGHLEYGESFSDCAVRETKEEVGINIVDISLIGLTNDLFPNKHYITIAVSASLKTGIPQIMEPEKISKIDWFPLKNLPKPLFLPTVNLLESNCLCICGSGKKLKECHLI